MREINLFDKTVFLGTGNGDPSSHENVKCNYRRAFHGKLQSIFAVCGNTVIEVEIQNMQKVPIQL